MTARRASGTAERRPAIRVADRVRAALFLSPSFLPALACVLIFLWFGADEGGFVGTTWLPATLGVLGVLAVALRVLPAPRPTRTVLVAVALLAAYAAWSVLSILWADQQGTAWDGANRTLLYAAVFALFALWPLRGGPAAILLGAFGLGVACIAAIELIRASGAAYSIDFFHEGRLSEPVGYANANVALWFCAFWPCLVLAGRQGVPAILRGLFLAGAGMLASAAILGQSRGWLFVLPAVVLLAVALIPGRARTILALGAVGLGLLAILGPLLDVYEAFDPEGPPGEAFSHAVRLVFVMSFALGVLSYLATLGEGFARPSEQFSRRAGKAVIGAFALACVAALVAFSAVEGNPVSRASDAWAEFKAGGDEETNERSRFGSSFATHRYDYWRVGWQSFEDRPLVGVGADNFERDYLQRGRSLQTPRYPHSIEVRTLSQTGLIGALLLGGGLMAALIAAIPALRQADLAGAAAGAALMVFAYWLAHGSLDWLWEYPGLGGPAFAGVGMAVAVAAGRKGPLASLRPLLTGRLRIGIAIVIALLLALDLVLPWIAERDLREARRVAADKPGEALSRLDRAADLNPFSPVPEQTAFLIELRLGRPGPAAARLRAALERDPEDPFSHLQLGALASAAGRRAEAIRQVERAYRLHPRNLVIKTAREDLRGGAPLDPERINDQFLRDIQVRTGPE